MAHLQAIEYEGYAIRRQKTTVKGHEYERHVVDFGIDRNGKRVRRTFTTDAKARETIRKYTDLLFNHYRGLATREDSVKFWNIKPEAVAAVIDLRVNAG